MAIEVTIRHVDIGEGAKAHAHERAQKILDEFPTVENVHMILDGQRHEHIAEVVAQGKPHLRIEAKSASSAGILQAIDEAVEKAEKQLRKTRSKIVNHRSTGLPETPADEE